MVSRRGLPAGLAGAIAAGAAACTGGGFGREAVAAIEAVDGVSATDLEFGSGGALQGVVRGVITIEAADRAELLAIFDHAIGALVALALDSSRQGTEIQEVTGTDGRDEVGVRDLLASSAPGERITVSMLADRY
ncbi:hypothetical protein [Brachybacterium vulturis]|uniref:hypothetical protein n=1 Tax=Brachybacterium vulturis TaxID=2017484 RepID=UPI003734EC64